MFLYDQLDLPGPNESHVLSRDDAEFIFDLVKSQSCSCTLELGFSWGCSTAYIVAASNAPHVVVALRGQHTERGLHNIRKLGLAEFLTFIDGPSHLIFPRLINSRFQASFILANGTHRFEAALVDFFYCDKVLKSGGMLMIDEAWLPSIQMVSAFIRSNRTDYTEIATPTGSQFLFRKEREDVRAWNHFEPFGLEP